MAGGENPGSGRPENNWGQCLVDDNSGFSSHRGVHGNIPFAVRNRDVGISPRAAEKSGKWYRGVVEATDCFMARWHRNEAQRNRLRHAAEDAKSGDMGTGVGGRG